MNHRMPHGWPLALMLPSPAVDSFFFCAANLRPNVKPVLFCTFLFFFLLFLFLVFFFFFLLVFFWSLWRINRFCLTVKETSPINVTADWTYVRISSTNCSTGRCCWSSRWRRCWRRFRLCSASASSFGWCLNFNIIRVVKSWYLFGWLSEWKKNARS